MTILPEKIEANIADAAARVAQVRTENALVFPIFTDLHTENPGNADTQQFFRVLQTLCNRIKPNGVIDLGDNLAMLGRKNHIATASVQELLRTIFDAVQTAAGGPLYTINGNHDGVGTDFFKPIVWNDVAKAQYDAGTARYAANSSYYYVDFPAANTRFVFCSIPYESDLAAEYPHPLWAFGADQIAWLKNEALVTPHRVLLFCHVPMYYCDRHDPAAMLEVWNGERALPTQIRELCGYIEDINVAAGVLNASGNVAVCFSGHMHEDSMWAPLERRGEDVNPLMCPQVVTARALAATGEENTFGFAIDVLIWCPEEKRAHLIRVGDGTDRVIG